MSGSEREVKDTSRTVEEIGPGLQCAENAVESDLETEIVTQGDSQPEDVPVPDNSPKMETSSGDVTKCRRRLQNRICGLPEPASHPSAVAREFYRMGP